MPRSHKPQRTAPVRRTPPGQAARHMHVRPAPRKLPPNGRSGRRG